MTTAVFDRASPDDQEYFLRLYESYKRIMLSTACKYSPDAAASEDIVQDALVKLIQKIPTMRRLSNSALASYIVITVKNTVFNQHRRQTLINRCTVYDEFTDSVVKKGIVAPSPTPEELLLLAERKEEFLKVWHKLPERDQDLLAGKYVIGLTDAELAGLFDCKTDSIRVLLARSRKRALTIMTKEAYNYDES